MDDSIYKSLLEQIPRNEYLREFQKEADKAIDKSGLLQKAKKKEKLKSEIFQLIISYRFRHYDKEFLSRKKEFHKYEPEIRELTKKLRATNVFGILAYVMELMLQNIYLFNLAPITDEAKAEFTKHQKSVWTMWEKIQKIKVFGPAALVLLAQLQELTRTHKRGRGHQTRTRQREFVRELIDLVKANTGASYEEIFSQIEQFLAHWPEWKKPIVFESIRDIYWARSRKKSP